MTIDPQWQLLKAAESALTPFKDLFRFTEDLLSLDEEMDDERDGLLSEAEQAWEFLRDAINAVNMCQADEVPAAVSSSLRSSI